VVAAKEKFSEMRRFFAARSTRFYSIYFNRWLAGGPSSLPRESKNGWTRATEGAFSPGPMFGRSSAGPCNLSTAIVTGSIPGS
jgi:hypothetical protein